MDASTHVAFTPGAIPWPVETTHYIHDIKEQLQKIAAVMSRRGLPVEARFNPGTGKAELYVCLAEVTAHGEAGGIYALEVKPHPEFEVELEREFRHAFPRYTRTFVR